MDTNNNTLTSVGADTYHYTVGGGATNLPGAGGGLGVNAETATWVYHDPAAAVTVSGGGPASQRNPLAPGSGQAVEIWLRAGFQFEVNKAVIYYTTDGTNPEGAYGQGQGTTKVAEAFFAGDDTVDGTIDWWKGTVPAGEHSGGTEIRYKVAVYKQGINPISDAVDARIYGLTEYGITNLNPASPRVWIHNNLNTNDTRTGLAEGLHILRARSFLPREGKSSVFNTFAQTFYYDAGPVDGVVANPGADGTNITSPNFDLIIRADATATEVEVNIIDSSPGNDDAVTGLANGNGLTNGVPVFVPATAEAPQSLYSQLYPALTDQYRFRYLAVPSSGTATVTVRLREATTAVLPDRTRTLTRTLNTLAPSRSLFISNPAADGSLELATSNSSVTIRVCNTTSGAETSDVNNYSVLVNGVLQARQNYLLVSSPFCGGGYTTLAYRWGNIVPGTNIIEAIFAGSVVLTDTRVMNISYPVDPNLDSDGDRMTDVNEDIAGTDPGDPNSVLQITDLDEGTRLVVWDSVSNRVYEVQATTNLTVPFSPVSGLIQASGPTSFHSDGGSPASEKYYRIEVIPQ